MKNLKSVFAVVMSVMILASCTSKQDVLAPKTETKVSEVKKVPVKMTGVEFTAKYGVKLNSLDYGDGNMATKGKKSAATTLVSVWLNDLTWVQTGTIKEINVSPNARWVGITNFASTTSSTGATVPTGCNGFYWVPPGAGVTFSCTGNGPGFYRGFTEDNPIEDPLTGDLIYNVHVTDFNQQL